MSTEWVSVLWFIIHYSLCFLVFQMVWMVVVPTLFGTTQLIHLKHHFSKKSYTTEQIIQSLYCSNVRIHPCFFFFWFLTWPTGSAKKMCQSPDAAGNCQVLSQLSLVAGHGHIGAEALKSALQRGGLEGWWWKPTWSWWNWWIYTGSRCTLYIDIHMHVYIYIYISILIFFDEIDEWRGIDQWID